MLIRAKILKHRTLKGFTGSISNGILYNTTSFLVPQLYPASWDIESVSKSLLIEKQRKRLEEEFDLVDVILVETNVQ